MPGKCSEGRGRSYNSQGENRRGPKIPVIYVTEEKNVQLGCCVLASKRAGHHCSLFHQVFTGIIASSKTLNKRLGLGWYSSSFFKLFSICIPNLNGMQRQREGVGIFPELVYTQLCWKLDLRIRYNRLFASDPFSQGSIPALFPEAPHSRCLSEVSHLSHVSGRFSLGAALGKEPGKFWTSQIVVFVVSR